jgi:RNA polymerase sigma factor (TIGR02999 family)
MQRSSPEWLIGPKSLFRNPSKAEVEGMSDLNVTALLEDLAGGDAEALDRLFPIVYEELRRVAHGQLHLERAGHTLNTTALVHEAYLKLVKHPPDVQWQSRVHFFAVAARAMRQILVNYAKARSRAKRGGDAPHVSLEEAVVMPEARAEELVALDEALDRLEAMSERQSRVVECRYFGGLTIEETAQVLGVSVVTVKRDWATARAWLYREVRESLT